MTNSANNAIPFVPENTIDPAAGLNQAINVIDALLQLSVVSLGENVPPASPASGTRYIVGTAPTGAWAGQANKLARYLDGAWSFFVASTAVSGGVIYARSDSGWAAAGGSGAANWGGIGGTLADQADLANALAVREYTLTPGNNISIDRSNPSAPVISAAGGGTGGMSNPMTAVGDLIRGGTDGAAERLGVGTNGRALMAVGGLPTWADLPPQCIAIACSDETTALTVGAGKVTFRMPYAFTLTGIRASLTTAQGSGSLLTVDVNEAGVSVLSTLLTIDNTEKTSATAATAAVISGAALADDAEITVDIDQIGDGTAKGLKIYLIGRPA